MLKQAPKTVSGSTSGHTPCQTQWQAQSSYAKSADTRQAILHAAIDAFGKGGFAAVTTRQIASAAKVNQPSISYYFGGKNGLYLACAQEIIDRYIEHTSDTSIKAIEELDKGVSPEQARALLQNLIAGLADLMLTADDLAQASRFVEREMRDPGLAYQFLYDNFWAPGIELVARLIATVRGTDKIEAATRAEAVMLISSLVAFSSDQSIAVQAMGWQTVGPDELAMVLDILNQKISTI